MARGHKSLDDFMAMENENFGGYRINGKEVSREEFMTAYNGEQESPEALGFDEDYIAKLLGGGIKRRGGNY